jgi:hypothetical protein
MAKVSIKGENIVIDNAGDCGVLLIMKDSTYRAGPTIQSQLGGWMRKEGLYGYGAKCLTEQFAEDLTAQVATLDNAHDIDLVDPNKTTSTIQKMSVPVADVSYIVIASDGLWDCVTRGIPRDYTEIVGANETEALEGQALYKERYDFVRLCDYTAATDSIDESGIDLVMKKNELLLKREDLSLELRMEITEQLEAFAKKGGMSLDDIKTIVANSALPLHKRVGNLLDKVNEMLPSIKDSKKDDRTIAIIDLTKKTPAQA